MSDYTPTTEDVRTSYGAGFRHNQEAFDRWLVAHDAEVVAEERAAAVAWLREEGWPEIAATAIEAGDHRNFQSPTPNEGEADQSCKRKDKS
jgi:hypothetical protein